MQSTIVTKVSNLQPQKHIRKIIDGSRKYIPDVIETEVTSQTKGFSEFLGKYSIISLALGTIIGASTKDAVNVLVTGILSPLIAYVLGAIMPNTNLKDWSIPLGDPADGKILMVGEFLTMLIQMLLTLLIIYIVVAVVFRQKEIIGLEKKKDEGEEITTTTKITTNKATKTKKKK